MDEILKRDQNFVTVLAGITDDSNQYVTMLRIDPTTKRLLVSATGTGAGTVTSVGTGTGLTGGTITTTGTISLSTALAPMATLTGNSLKVLRVNVGETAVEYATVGSGTVTTVSVVTANGISGSVANATTTPAITLTLGAITPSSVQISGLTASQITATDGSKNLVSLDTATYPSLTELSYVKGVTSSLQTQINAKGTGTVTSVGIATANGVSGSGAITTSGNITITLGAITPSTVNGNTFTTGSSTYTGTAGQTYTFPSTTDTIAGISVTQTLTNKRNNPRIVSAASYTTDTGTSLDVATCDEFVITAQAGALKFNNPSGTPTEGCKLIVRIKDNGTARALTYDTQFRAMGTALPSTTVLSKTLYMGFIFNATDTKWDLVSAPQEV